MRNTFVTITLLSFIVASYCNKQIQWTVEEDAKKTVAEYVLSYGYKFEEHKVVTDDGYILTLWRIPGKNDGKNKKVGRPLLLQHGLLDNGFSFLFQEIQKNLPIMLLEQGNFDIWIGNNRGTCRSLEHVNKKDYDWSDFSSKYWDFSWDEMAQYDMPSIFDYISEKSGYQKINYVCHSQGCSALLAMASSNLTYVNSRINKMVWLAPAMYASPNPSFIVILLLDILHGLDILEFINFKDIMAQPFIMYLSRISGKYITSVWLWALNLLCGFTKEEHIDYNRIPLIAANEFGGSSLQNFKHWQQAFHKQVFQMHDFGTKKNIEKYGQPTPPVYDTKPYSNFNFRSLVYSFGADRLVNPSNVIQFVQHLPKNSFEYQEIPDTNHLSGFWGDFCHDTYYPKIVKFFME